MSGKRVSQKLQYAVGCCVLSLAGSAFAPKSPSTESRLRSRSSDRVPPLRRWKPGLRKMVLTEW